MPHHLLDFRLNYRPDDTDTPTYWLHTLKMLQLKTEARSIVPEGDNQLAGSLPAHGAKALLDHPLVRERVMSLELCSRGGAELPPYRAGTLPDLEGALQLALHDERPFRLTFGL